MRGGSFGAFPFFIVMEQEIWKVVDGYNGAYRVSNKGNFESCINMGNHKIDGIWRRKKLNKRKNGYYVVSLTKDGKTELLYIHRLVAKAFCDNPNGYNEIDHLDSNKNNNSAKNLKWVSRVENLSNPHAQQERLRIAKEKGTAITQLSLDGKFIRTFYSLREVERIYPNINRRRVNDCAKGLIDSVCGYKWKFTNKEQ